MLTTDQKYKFEDTASSLRLSIPYRKLAWHIFGLSFALLFIGTQFLVPYFINTFISDEIYSPTMISFPLAVLLIFVCVLMALELLWLLFGFEVVEVGSNEVAIKHQVFGFGITRKFSLSRVNGIFVSHQDNSDLNYYLDSKEFKFFFLSFKQGKVAINYGKTILGGINTFRFGTNLEEGEAKKIVKLIHEKFPQYIYKKVKNTG